MVPCPACSAAVPPEARFCPSCGSALDAATVESGAAGSPGATVGATLPARSPATPASDTSSSGRHGAGRFLPGTVLAGRYRIFGLLGKGGMGEVYRADDLKLGQPVALKFLPPGLERDRGRLERFLAEVRTARQVTHSNVCRVYDIGEAEGQHFLSMEFVDGEDLASLLRRIGRLPHDKAVQIARQLCAGVHAAHEQGILHRDLKPANVMIDGRGRVRITDFGLARLADSIEAGDRSGTPAYMSPEQLRGEEVTARSDIYALGLVINEIFTGRHAFDGVVDLARRDPDATPARPSTRLEGLDPTVERAILRCLERDPAQRPASALAVAAALPGGDPLAAALAAGETPSPELVAEAGTREAMRPGRAIALAAIGLVLFVGAARWGGTMSLLSFLPLEKKPDVLVDRAQGMLEEVGYDEPVYRGPADRAWSLFLWESVLDQVEEADSTTARWEGLRERPDALTFWYRQSPSVLRPEPVQEGPVYRRGPVRLGNPIPQTAGEVLISLDLAGRLRRLEVLPKRLSTRDADEPDWAPLFALAGLDPERFRPDRPRYQRFFVPDHRRAWLGTREELPDVELRVEAGSFEGRPCLFDVSPAAAIEFLSEDPETTSPALSRILLDSLTPVLILGLILGAAWLAQRHLRQGRADRRGALRFAMTIGGGISLVGALDSHVLFTTAWAGVIWPLIAPGVFFGLIMWLIYVAAEPIGRRVWPTMFVSSSRLLSRPRIVWRDPLLGRSALLGLAAGALLFALGGPLRRVILTWVQGAPPYPIPFDADLFLGQRAALGGVLEALLNGVQGFLLVLVVVVLRLALKRPWLAAAVTVCVWPVVWGTGLASVDRYLFEWLGAAVSLVVLLRAGVLTYVLASVVALLAGVAAVPDWSAWYAQGAVMAVTAAAAIAVYGVWAAVARSGADPPRGGEE
jgi:serine/threonine-protein kinase